MKTPAALFVESGKPLIIDDVDLPDPGPTQVQIRQFATGVCHSQLHELDRPNPAVPVLLGHESTGVVTAAGKDVPHVKVGDHVMVTWVPRNFNSGRQPIPAVVKYNGTQVNYGAPANVGTFTWSRDVVVDELMVVPLEKGVDTGATAPVGCAVMTGVGAAINAAQIRAGQSAAIIGVGGVGLSVVAGCHIAGAYPIIAVDLSDEKIEFAKQFGATHGINAAKEDPIAKIREMMGGGFNAGVDVAFDAIGAKISMEQVLQMARGRKPGDREGGTAVLVGVPHGEPATPPMFMLFGGKVFRGAPGGCSEPDHDFPLMIQWFKDGKLPLDKMITRRYKLEQINEACTALRKGEIAGRAIVEF
ncbi:MAG TPA: zinc-binding dehydrogenase [Dehalococcoidia bacterium]|nr:zinc-binding dehydrogenase [Dehalococcoidia bacterium]